ncbi:MAG TPA: hypothetical protein VFQ53_17045 [Kofleriaceae bacterium]|nr:hypothetical protein [Kofleriaceae bacterium]
MRVLVDGGMVHCWLPAGTFTIDRDHAITWKTRFEPLRHHAASTDEDVRVLPPHDSIVGDDVVDAAIVDGGRAAIVVAGTPPMLRIVELSSRRVELELPLRGSGPRLPGISDDERWAEDDVLAGDHRGIRVFPAGDRVVVTANDSGHVVVVSLADRRIERSYRVPAGSENTVYGARSRAGLVVGMKWNHRHSDLFHVSDDGALLARWPTGDDEDAIRWGMPTPVVVGEHVVTYSDEGPHAGCLAVLALPDLVEIAHHELPHAPTDLHASGDRFAAVSSQVVTIGRIVGGELAIEGSWTIHDVMAAAGVQPPPRASAATTDGRGRRAWFDETIERVVVDGDCSVMSLAGGEVRALEPAGPRVLVEGRATPVDLAALFTEPARRVFVDARDGRVLFTRGTTLELVERATGRLVVSVPRPEEARAARIVHGGLVYREEDRESFDTIVIYATTDDGFTAELARGHRDRECQQLVSDGTCAWWVELQYESAVVRDEVTERGLHVREALAQAPVRALARWRVGQPVERAPLEHAIQSFARVDDHTYVLSRNADDAGEMHLYRIGDDGAFERLTRSALPHFVSGLVVASDRAFFLTPTTGVGPIEPAELWQIELATGAATVLATATIGSFSSLQLAGDDLVWLESRDLSMSFFQLGVATDCAAICRLPLSR